jgi:hypothetical protein
MRTTNKEQQAKIELLIEFLQQHQEFNPYELTSQLQITKTMPWILLKNGYVKKIGRDLFLPTDLINGLTVDSYRDLVADYQKQAGINREQKKITKLKVEKKPISISDFLNNKLQTKDSSKELAQQIYNLIKSYL